MRQVLRLGGAALQTVTTTLDVVVPNLERRIGS